MKLPVFGYKCVSFETTYGWFTVGKVYPAQGGYVADDQGYEWREGDIRDALPAMGFVPVWLLPDGTELEALP